MVDNGIFQLRLTNPGGTIVGIQYGGIDNLLELNNPSLNGGFVPFHSFFFTSSIV